MVSKNRLKYLSSLKEKKYRDRDGKFLVEGLRLCEELLTSEIYRQRIENVFFCPEAMSSQRAQQFIAECKARGLALEEIDAPALHRIADTITPQGVSALAKKADISFEHLLAAAQPYVVALDGISDPGNLGTILRTANWFGAGGALIFENSVEWSNPKAVRASMGAVFHIPVVAELHRFDTLSELKDAGYSIVAAEATGDTVLTDAVFAEKTVLLFGGETSGISREVDQLVTTHVRIPGKGKGDSLNVAVAAGIILSEVFRRKSQK